MLVGRIKGSVVSTNKVGCLDGLKLLIVQPVLLETMTEQDDPIVAIDAVGAGEGELVMCVGGSSARGTPETKDTPADYSIVAILDSIDLKGRRIFQKYK